MDRRLLRRSFYLQIGRSRVMPTIFAILLAVATPGADTASAVAPATAVNMDMVDTPLGDLLKTFAADAKLKLDTSALPSDILTEPVTITYSGDSDGFLRKLHDTTELRFAVHNVGGTAMLAVKPKRSMPSRELIWVGLAVLIALVMLWAYRARPRFSLRTLLMFTTVVAIVVAFATNATRE
jgi:hypothetical protein